jgi:hypothetical protein
MSYDNWKLQAPDEGQDLGDDVECIHGVDLFAPCEKCKPLAANGGEGDDMMDPDKLMEPLTDWRFEEYLKHASNPELKRARFAIDREQARRLEEARAAIRELDPNAPKPRATRRDKGTTRAPKEHAA